MRIIQSNIDNNGNEFLVCCISCRIDDRKICTGEKLCCANNHIKNTYIISTSGSGNANYTEIEKGKDEVLSLAEFEKWITDHNYSIESCPEAI